MGRILLDTDVLIDFFRGFEPALIYIKENRDSIVLSPIVIAEIYSGARKQEEPHIKQFFASFPVVPLNAEIGMKGGILKREYAASHGIGLADALIASTVLEKGLGFATLNVKHYPMFLNLHPAYKK